MAKTVIELVVERMKESNFSEFTRELSPEQEQWFMRRQESDKTGDSDMIKLLKYIKARIKDADYEINIRTSKRGSVRVAENDRIAKLEAEVAALKAAQSEAKVAPTPEVLHVVEDEIAAVKEEVQGEVIEGTAEEVQPETPATETQPEGQPEQTHKRKR